MFHGTTRGNAQLIRKNGFRPSEDGMLGKGVYVSRDIQKASRYPIEVDPSQRVVLKLNVNVGKVVKIDRQGHQWQKLWHSKGYDTAWVPPDCGMVPSGLEEDCIWDPSRILVIEVMAPFSVPVSYYNYTPSHFETTDIWTEFDSKVYIPTNLQHSTKPEDNNVYVMFHGTTRRNAQLIRKNGFRPSEDGMLGKGVYVSRDIQKASRYPIGVDPSQRVVLKLNVNVGKVVKIDRQGHQWQKLWHSKGYDTAWVPPDCGMVPSGLEEDCIWDPSRIRVIEVMAPTFS
ncbi:uncharacterized protein LOC120521502 [Polypterus senegalus]|uniref:uncharacterized protein LOC120521502 n=1 Tax=Polypterus senegalus TaxID=55291 RepID=UPI0019665009|nr:uncharacterized protein LOC120521502 [Polypterus senegalus]XP_039599014.1 uncharacterized protein LOC120521502 [Polypterus senegalus]